MTSVVEDLENAFKLHHCSQSNYDNFQFVLGQTRPSARQERKEVAQPLQKGPQCKSNHFCTPSNPAVIDVS